MNKDIFKNINNSYWIILILFIILSLYTGSCHEPWADEAQGYLLARDCSVLELITKRLRYEGHPILWYLILKFFIFIKLQYNYFFIIPVIFSAAGAWIFLFKSKFPTVIKILVLFSYFIFYQYTTIIRSYCLVFPVIALTATIYPKRFTNPFRYLICLLLLSNICFYTQILAASLFLLWFIDILKKKLLEKDTNSFVLIFIIFLFFQIINIIILYPSQDFPAYAYWHIKKFEITKIFHVFALSLFASKLSPLITTLSVFLYFLWPYLFYKNFQNAKKYFFLTGIPALILSLFYYQEWHLGVIFLIFIFVFWIDWNENFKNNFKNTIFCLILVSILLIQSFWTFYSLKFDINNPYCGSFSIASFIKENKLTNYKIYTLGYRPTAVLPYFNSNIFANRTENKAYWIWTRIPNEKLYEKKPEVFIVAKQRLFSNREYLKIVENNNYIKYSFDGNMVFKNKIRESNAYFLYIRRDLVK